MAVLLSGGARVLAARPRRVEILAGLWDRARSNAPPAPGSPSEVTRIVLDTLRQTTRPLATREVTFALMKHRGLKTDDLKLVRLIQQRVVACLGHWKRRGYLTSGTANLKGLQS